MEPSGRNRWQPVANRTAGKIAERRQNRCVGCDQLPKSFHGKEGVGGSSPPEGLSWNGSNEAVCGLRALANLRRCSVRSDDRSDDASVTRRTVDTPCDAAEGSPALRTLTVG